MGLKGAAQGGGLRIYWAPAGSEKLLPQTCPHSFLPGRGRSRDWLLGVVSRRLHVALSPDHGLLMSPFNWWGN